MKHFYQNFVKKEMIQILAVLLFVVLFFLFSSGIAKISHNTDKNESELLHLAITRGITHCYATEGHYPESLEYLQEHYGIIYDSDKYFVDYQVLGKNIYPDVTIIEK